MNLPSRTINARVPALHLCQVAEIREPFDVVFLVVKAYDTKWACQLIEPVLAQDGFVVGLQNGMTHEDIASVVGRERTIGAVIEIASNMFTPGVTNRQNDPRPPGSRWARSILPSSTGSRRSPTSCAIAAPSR